MRIARMRSGASARSVFRQVLDFTKYDAPQTASKPRRGLSSSITLTVQ